MKKFFTVLLSLTLFCGTIMAVPAKKGVKVFTQPDGTNVSVILQGDEHVHFYSTVDGVMLAKDAQGYMKYATTNANGQIVAGEYIAKDAAKRSTIENEYIANISKTTINSSLKANKTKKLATRTKVISKSAFPTIGEAKGLIILAQYSDVKFSSKGTNEEFTNKMNKEGYSTDGATGSAKDFFISQSSGKFTPHFDVVGPVTLPQKMSYYGANDTYGDDLHPDQMIVDACKVADSLVDFSQYDLDKDGQVDLIYVIYAGYGEAQGASENTIWPHAWSLDDAGQSLKLDNVKINSYACSNECMGDGSTSTIYLDGIGTFCHEFSHCLGLPDMYDVDYSGNFGMGEWDIMDAGSYANDGLTPTGYSGFERSSVGWLTLEELKETTMNVSLEALSTSNKAYKIVSDANPDEYYVLENRQLSGWDAYLPNHGLLITHVDYLQSAWDANSVNDVLGKQRVIIIPGDNKLVVYNNNYTAYMSSLLGDVYPGSAKNTSLTDTSVPAANLNNGSKMGKPVTKIAESNGLITFNFMEGVVKAPVAIDATEVTSNSFTANWNAVEGVDSYTLTVREASGDPQSNVILKENFSNFTENSTTEISDLDSYMSVKGWTGTKVYPNVGCAKIGSAKANGVLTTPALDMSGESGNVTVAIDAAEWSTTEKSLKVELLNSVGTALESKTITLPYSSVINFTTGAKDCKVRFSGSKRATISKIELYAGTYSSTDLQSAPALAPAAPIVVKGITTTSYKVEGLGSGVAYNYRVTAVKGESESEASNSIKVSTATSGADLVESNTSVGTIGNEVIVNTIEGETINVYSIDGVLKYSQVSTAGENRIVLSNGVYILRIGNMTAKVAILN